MKKISSEIAKQRQKIGLHRARINRRYHIGRLEKYNQFNPKIIKAIYEYLNRNHNHMSAQRIADINGISRATLYIKLKKYYNYFYSRQYQINPDCQPFLRGYIGSKLNLLTTIENYMPHHFNRYIEAFLGSGALLFSIQPKTAIINDADKDVITSYKILSRYPKKIIKILEKYKKAKNLKQQFYYFRKRLNYYNDNPIKRAAQFIYIQATAFRGLIRNRNHAQKQYSAHYGFRNFSANLFNIIQADANYLENNKVTILNKDYKNILQLARKNDFVYIDPPYSTVRGLAQSRFYSHKFNQKDQYNLYQECQRLTDRGVKFLQTNADDYYIRDLYQSFKIIPIKQQKRLYKKERKRYGQVIITNY